MRCICSVCCRCSNGDVELQAELEIPFPPIPGMYLISQRLKPFVTVVVEGIAWNDDDEALLAELSDCDRRTRTCAEVESECLGSSWTIIS